MHTARLETCFSLSCHNQMSLPGGTPAWPNLPQMREYPTWLDLSQGVTLPCDLSHDAWYVTYSPRTDRCLWKHYFPATSFASGDELMHIRQDFAVHLNWYYLGFICSLFLCDFIHLYNGSCLKLKGRLRILLSLILYLYLCWYSRYFYGCFTSSVLSHWTLMISKTTHSVECYNYEF